MNELFNQVKCGIPSRLAEQVKTSEEGFPTLDDFCRSDECINKASCWRSRLCYCLQMICRWHFGFRGKLLPQEILEKGVDMALTYFGVVDDRLQKMTAETDWTEEVAWFEPYSEALLMAVLGGRTREHSQLSGFLHPRLPPEKIGARVEIEPALADVLLCIAATFQSSPMDIAPLVERLPKCRKRRPKLLYKAWLALKNDDRPTFASALADSTANFAKTTAEDTDPLTAIALQESILAALAYERGWTDLAFEPPIAARLVTQQSLELKRTRAEKCHEF